MTETYPLAMLRCSGSPTTRQPLDEDCIREYRPGRAYRTGDMVEFCGVLYICVAPEGEICRRSPAERHRDWEELEQ